jgi:ribosomal protein L7/L12
MNSGKITRKIAQLILDKEYIGAIKEYRTVYSSDLVKAKNAIDSVKDNPRLLNEIINNDILETNIGKLENIAKELICTYPREAKEVIELVIKIKDR